MKILKYILLMIFVHSVGFYILNDNNEFNVYSYNTGSLIGIIAMVIYFNTWIIKSKR